MGNDGSPEKNWETIVFTRRHAEKLAGWRGRSTSSFLTLSNILQHPEVVFEFIAIDLGLAPGQSATS
jgi:hypothetical protein